ncbi:sensor histidine kinase [Lysinibacillus xylanilyticus]|uniref:sensor histidine kinase n=1 Tax=Lysinibacillus xylanilyticus TaxID=582475 RepID=UPI003D000CD1
MSKKSFLGLNTIKSKLFWVIIPLYIILGFYVLFISYATPFLSIELKERNGQWEIEKLAYKDWAEKEQISIGDIVLSINETKISNIPYIQYDPSIRGANRISIQKSNGQILNINVHHLDIPRQFYMQVIFPSIYYLIAFCITLYLYFWKRNIKHINFLIVFILTVSLAYISSGASAQMNSIGLIVNSSCLLLCLILLLHFSKNYFMLLKIKWPFIDNINYLYTIPIFSITLRLIRLAQPKFASIDSLIILSIFLIILALILWILIYGYLKYRLIQLKILIIGLVLPFLPFLLLFVLPEVLFKQPILSADICALFLLLIPFNFIFMQLAERLFDITYYVTRFRYYLTISIFFTLWLLTGLNVLPGNLIVKEILLNFLFIFLSIIVFLYIKSKIDYYKRKVLFPTNGDYIHKLYAIIEKIGKSHKIDDMLNILITEIALHLELTDVSISTYDLQKKQFILTKNSISSLEKSTDVSIIIKLKPGEIVKKDHVYIAYVNEDATLKRVLLIGHRNTIRLKEEELLWLELLLSYTNSFIENTKVIEELLKELKQVQKSERKNELTWFKKLLWLRIDEEKFLIAQELHDDILQDYLHIARQVELLIHEKNSTTIQSKQIALHKQMVCSIEVLRSYCETLKPPFLCKMGLYIALEQLVHSTSERAKFKLISTLDRLYLEDEKLNLVIYRLFQELLNNALKHSQATTVSILLKELNNGFELIYSDDGVGCDMHQILQSNSLGIQGMQERVEAFNGQFIIDSHLNKGMHIRIIIIERSETNDYSTYS